MGRAGRRAPPPPARWPPAPASLAITQPAVSYAIGELEHAVGVPLLDRTAQGVTPTVYGDAMLQRSAVIFNELRQGLGEIATLADPAVGELRIGTTPPMSAVASAVFNRLMPRYPRMRFDLLVQPTDVLLRALRRRDIELVLSRLAGSIVDEDLTSDVLFHDELAVLCGKDNSWARRRNVSLTQLVDEPWVFPAASGFLTQVISGAFEAQGIAMPRAAVTTSSTYALTVLVANGPFLAMHPRTMLTTPRRHPQLTAVDVRLRSTRGPVALISLKNRTLSPSARLFLQNAREIAGAHGTSARKSAKTGRP